jgi:hypothetical protein
MNILKEFHVPITNAPYIAIISIPLTLLTITT